VVSQAVHRPVHSASYLFRNLKPIIADVLVWGVQRFGALSLHRGVVIVARSLL